MTNLVSRFIVILVFAYAGSVFAQPGLWQDVVKQARQGSDTSATRYFDNDDQALRNLLNLVPKELSGQSATIDLPMPDGSLASFSIVESSIMETGLAAKYPEIKSYKVYGIDDPGASGRVDISPKGFRGMVYTSQGRIFIDPDWQNPATQRYLSRASRGEPSKSGFQCRANQLPGNQSYSPDISYRTQNRITGSLLEYRLAVSTTQEYALAPGVNTSGPIDDPTIISDALAEINTAINRVNVIYERDLGIRLVLVANNDQLIDVDASSPLAGFNNDGLQLLANNKSWIDTRIGVGSYDIGHVFSTGAGGVARIASTCDDLIKAEGVTGLSNPVGDVFYIDYVAHEIGHQFGAEHTFNGTTLDCGGANRRPLTAFEPGSGSTVMAYAGICGAENIQTNSDATFHSKSIEQIDSFVSSGGSCSAIVSAGNPGEPVADAGVDRVIPVGTPFLLAGSGTDTDPGDILSYQWDQIDAGTETSSATLGDDLGDNALIRSYVPQLTGDRDIPALGTQVLDGPFDVSEALPCTARDLNMRLTVRDGKSGQGTDDLKLTVDSNSGPFRITSQTSASSIYVSSGAVSITWDVANTNIAPVSCANVDIDLLTFSSDHSTYAVTPLKTVANNGNNLVVLPDNSNSNARFRVSCNDNIFYDISDEDLTIVSTAGPGINPFATTGNTTFFNDFGLVFAASAGTCNTNRGGGGGGGGSFAGVGTASSNSIFDYLWLIFLSSLVFGVSLRRFYSGRFQVSATLRAK